MLTLKNVRRVQSSVKQQIRLFANSPEERLRDALAIHLPKENEPTLTDARLNDLLLVSTMEQRFNGSKVALSGTFADVVDLKFEFDVNDFEGVVEANDQTGGDQAWLPIEMTLSPTMMTKSVVVKADIVYNAGPIDILNCKLLMVT